MANDVHEPDSLESNRSPSESTPAKKDIWEVLESLSKIVAALGIPIVLGIGSWVIQSAISQQTVSKDYVTIALGILQKEQGKDGSKSNAGLRRWAVDLLNSTSPVRLDPVTEEELITGKLNLQIPETKAPDELGPRLKLSGTGKLILRSEHAGIKCYLVPLSIGISLADLEDSELIKYLENNSQYFVGVTPVSTNKPKGYYVAFCVFADHVSRIKLTIIDEENMIDL